MMKCFFLILFLFSSALTSKVVAATLSPEEVVKRSLAHYPLVLQGLGDLEAARAELLKTNSIFDTKIKVDTNSRLEGFYSGDLYKVQVEKRLPFLGTKIFGGYRASNGTFPDYEGKMETLSDGETFLGVSFSLLRDGIIDINRFRRGIEQESVSQASDKLEQIKLKVQTMSLISYWAWSASVERVQILKEILQLAQTRMKGLKRRIQKGDLARIYKTENQQYIVKREADLKKANFQLQETAYILSLFNRDENGQPVVPNEKASVRMKSQDIGRLKFSQDLVDRIFSASFDLKILDSKLKQQKMSYDIARTQLLPKLDLTFQLSDDSGTGSSSRSPTLFQEEQRLFLNFEFPLENRKARGSKRKALAKQKVIKSQRQLMQDEMRQQAQVLVQKMNTYADLVDLTNEQVNLSRRLVTAEQKKFNSGASDLILLNLREEQLAEVRVKNLEMYLSYMGLKAKLYQLQAQFISDF